VKVLFVACGPPLPRDNGGRLRTFHLLEELSEHAEVVLVTLDREPASGMKPCPAEEIEAALPGLREVHLVRTPAAHKRLRQLTSLAGRHSYTEGMHRSPALVNAVRTGMSRFEPDLVHCDSLFCAHVHPSESAAEATWVLSMHNDEALLKDRLAATAGEWLRRTLYRREAEALRELQGSYFGVFDHVLAVSDGERARFEAQGARSALTVPNGVASLPRPAGPPPDPERDEPLRLLFVGSLNYEPNAQGLEWFVQEVAPRVRERTFVDIEIVGPGRRGPELPGVRYVGRVDDLAPVYARAHAAVVPLRAGAGSRLKVLEAMAHGVPLISTSLGVEGYDIHDGEQALIADDPAGLAERIFLLDASLRGDRRLAGALVDSGYDLARDYFWPEIGDDLARAYSEWAEPGEPPSSARATSPS
jgi:glycosyltransferase involved in cell wall biosynthesis